MNSGLGGEPHGGATRRAIGTSVGVAWGLALVVALSGCSGGGNGGGGQAYTVLFADAFGGSFPGSKWTTTGPAANFVTDSSRGGFSPPSLKIVGGQATTATAFASGWSSETGLRILVGIALPDDSLYKRTLAGLPAPTNVIEVFAEGSTTAVASLGFIRQRSDAAYGTELRYTVGSRSGRENLNWDTFKGQFMAFAFTVNPDGTSEWSRDAVRMYSDTGAGLRGVRMKLRLRGHSTDDWDIHVDDVEVRKY